MQFSTVAASLLLAGSALAQSSGVVMVQTVKVGGDNGELTFEPSFIQAPVDSMVQFQFWPKNHSVAQASFSQPCMPITQSNSSVTDMFWSGFMPTAANASELATYTIKINNTTPIWLYCAQANHCQSGMVAVINAVNSTGKTLEAFSAAAAKASANIAPGSSGATDGTTGEITASASSGSPAAATAAPSSSSSSSSSSGNQNNATGAASSVTFSAASLAIAAVISVFASIAL